MKMRKASKIEEQTTPRQAKCRVVYEPKGAALEYAPLAANLGVGCPHGCIYCYAPNAAHKKREDFHSGIRVRDQILKKLGKDAKLLEGDDREILLSFLSDPYSPQEMQLGLTREALRILIQSKLRFTVLTKGGTRATRDFDLLEGYEKARFGTTLVFTSQIDADKWEPNAAPISDRIRAVELAHEKGIKTWVSMEPVIDPKQALGLLKALHPIVDHWKIGKLNYLQTPETVDWRRFRDEVKGLLESYGADYYLKASLRNL